MSFSGATEADYTKVHRKVNLLIAWLRLKFRDDPSFPKSILPESNDEDGDQEPTLKTGVKLVDIQKLLEDPITGIRESSYPIVNVKRNINVTRRKSSSSPLLADVMSHPIKPCFVKVHQLKSTVVTTNQSEAAHSLGCSSSRVTKDDENVTVDEHGVTPCEYEAEDQSGSGWWETDNCEIQESGISVVAYEQDHTHVCNICHLIFLTSTKLLVHKYKVHRPQSHGKEQLKKSFLPSSSLCPFCGKMYSLRSHIRSHIQKEHPEITAETLATRQDIWEHFCAICKQGFRNLDNFISHLQQQHPKIYEEKLKRGELPKWVHQKKHQEPKFNTDSLESIVPCPDCGKQLPQTRLTPHLSWCRKKKLELGSEPFLCSQCGFQTKRKECLTLHMQIHSEVRKFKCKLCPYAAKQRQGLDSHFAKIHSPIMTQCSLCGELFTTTMGLKKHVRGVHENLRPYHCTLCTKAFKSKPSLNYHLKTHENPNGRKRGLNKDRDPKRRAPNKSKSSVLSGSNMVPGSQL